MTDLDPTLSWLEDHREEMADFLLSFGSVDSPRGREGPATDFLVEWLDDRGFAPRRQPVVADRENVVATVPGRDRSAPELVFNAHLDTAFGGPEEDARVLAEQTRFHREVWRRDGVLFGDDVVNDKGPMAAYLWAALALKATDVDLGGDRHLTGVVGEISGATVDEFRDERYLGTGVGTRRLVEGGVTGDYALVAETTDFAVASVECGVVWFKIRLTGEANYQPRLAVSNPDAVESEHPGALPKAARAVLALEEWAAEYANRHTEEYGDATVRPSAGVGAIRSGNPPAPSVAPGVASLYLDVRLPPGEGPGFVKPAVGSALADAGIEATVETYLFRRGYAAEGSVAPLTEAVETAHRRVRGGGPPDPAVEVTSMWRDLNVFNEVGIPSITVGPPRVVETVEGERAQGIRIDDIVDAAKLYALTAASVCGIADGAGTGEGRGDDGSGGTPD